MKKIMLSALLMAFSAIGFSLTITVHNTSNFCSDACVYDAKLINLTFHKTGSLDWVATERSYHTINPGTFYTWTVTPPTGYSVDWSTLSIEIKYCTSSTPTFGNSSSISVYNPCNCSNANYATVWDRNSDGDYNVHCELITGKSNGAGELPKEFKNGEKLEKVDIVEQTPVNTKSTAVTPNPSNGMFTLSPGTDLPASSYNVTVTDASGKVVYAKNNASTESPLQIDLTALPKGIYLLNIVSGDKKLSHRLMKE